MKKLIVKNYIIEINNSFNTSNFNNLDECRELFDEISTFYSFIQLESERFGILTLEYDWSNLYKLLDIQSNSTSHLTVTCNVSCIEIESTIQVQYRNLFTHYLEMNLYDFFLILNFSVPGCFTLCPTKLHDGTGHVINFKVDSAIFESSCYKSGLLEWPTISKVPLKITVNWYKSLKMSNKQISASNIERTIFAILNFCEIDSINPCSIIWLAHALEAIFNINTGGIQKTLSDRIFLTLGKPSLNTKKIKKVIIDFYSFRSRFVHGDFNIHHPSQNEVLDKNIEDYINNILNTQANIFKILLSTIQKMILSNCINIEFKEQIILHPTIEKS
ncbi:MAG: hypothetical protein H8D22_08455 [Candidatus Cloacimonetes bacterium]|nr:hypothetical protein [Candidatus Cloacimonadota bacterium]